MGEVVDITTGRHIVEVPSKDELEQRLANMESDDDRLQFVVFALAERRHAHEARSRSGICSPGFKNANLLVGRLCGLVAPSILESAVSYISLDVTFPENPAA